MTKNRKRRTVPLGSVTSLLIGAIFTATLSFITPRLIRAEDAEVNPAVQQAFLLMRDGRRAEAVDILKRAKTEHPDDFELHWAYSDAMASIGKYEEVIEEYREYLKKHERAGAAYIILAGIVPSYVEAQRLIDDGLKVDPSNPRLKAEKQFQTATHLLEHGKEEKALQLVEAAGKLNITPNEYHQMRGIAFLGMGRFKDAIQEYSISQKRFPLDDGVNAALAVAYAENGEFEKAYSVCIEASRLIESPTVRNCIGAYLATMGKAVESRKEFKKAIAAKPMGRSDYESLFWAYIALSDTKKAFEALSKFEQLCPDVCSKADRAYLDWMMFGPKEARKEYDELLKIDPRAENYLFMSGQNHVALGDYKTAIVEFERVHKLNSRHYSSWLQQGYAESQLGFSARALEDMLKAAKLAPNDFNVISNMGTLYFNMKRYNESIATWKKAIEADPESSGAYSGAGSAFAWQGNHAEALKMFQRALALAQTEQERNQLNEAVKNEKCSLHACEEVRHVEEHHPRSGFSNTSQRVILGAQDKAIGLQHDFVSPGHILLALLAQNGSHASLLLHRLKVDTEKLESDVEEAMPRSNSKQILGQVPFTPSSKKVLEAAVAEAQSIPFPIGSIDHKEVTTAHLLLGILHDREQSPAKVLAHSGVTEEKARGELIKFYETRPQDE